MTGELKPKSFVVKQATHHQNRLTGERDQDRIDELDVAASRESNLFGENHRNGPAAVYGAEAFGVYMDNQASTPLDPRVLDAMVPFLSGGTGNPHSSEHGYGWQADAAIAAARAAVAELVGADADEIIFTSGATEANNLAVLGAARAAPSGRRRIIVTAVEHKCVIGAARSMGPEGFEVIEAPVDADGIADAAALERLIDERVAVVSVMAMNNEVGAAQPVGAVADLCRAAGATFHSDAAQAMPVLGIDAGALGVDLMSLSAHKAYGPKGIGALFVRRGARGRIRPIMFGGGQEDGLRPGTLPTALCVGFGAACAILRKERETEATRIAGLRDRLLDLLLAVEPTLALNGPRFGRHAGNLNVRVAGLEADLVLSAARPLLAASTGSACTSGMPEPSHVLTAMGLNAAAATESIRLGLGRFTTGPDVEAATRALAAAFAEVRASR